MKITTDYTTESNPDNLLGGALSAYRSLYWLKSILQNFLSDSINIKDERLAWVFNFQDDDSDATKIDGLFEVDVAYSDKTKTACRTPMIFITLGSRQYSVRGINVIGMGEVASCGTIPMSQGARHKVIPMNITVVTEKYASTVALAELMEDFMLINENLFVADNHSISEFHVAGVSEVRAENIGEGPHAKVVYEQNIGVYVVGGISWTTDTQGPVFRGVTQKVDIK